MLNIYPLLLPSGSVSLSVSLKVLFFLSQITILTSNEQDRFDSSKARRTVLKSQSKVWNRFLDIPNGAGADSLFSKHESFRRKNKPRVNSISVNRNPQPALSNDNYLSNNVFQDIINIVVSTAVTPRSISREDNFGNILQFISNPSQQTEGNHLIKTENNNSQATQGANVSSSQIYNQILENNSTKEQKNNNLTSQTLNASLITHSTNKNISQNDNLLDKSKINNEPFTKSYHEVINNFKLIKKRPDYLKNDRYLTKNRKSNFIFNKDSLNGDKNKNNDAHQGNNMSDNKLDLRNSKNKVINNSLEPNLMSSTNSSSVINALRAHATTGYKKVSLLNGLPVNEKDNSNNFETEKIFDISTECVRLFQHNNTSANMLQDMNYVNNGSVKPQNNYSIINGSKAPEPPFSSNQLIYSDEISNTDVESITEKKKPLNTTFIIKNFTVNEDNNNVLDNLTDGNDLLLILESLDPILPGDVKTTDIHNNNNVEDEPEPVLKDLDKENVDDNMKNVLNNLLGIKNAHENIRQENKAYYGGVRPRSKLSIEDNNCDTNGTKQCTECINIYNHTVDNITETSSNNSSNLQNNSGMSDFDIACVELFNNTVNNVSKVLSINGSKELQNLNLTNSSKSSDLTRFSFSNQSDVKINANTELMSSTTEQINLSNNTNINIFNNQFTQTTGENNINKNTSRESNFYNHSNESPFMESYYKIKNNPAYKDQTKLNTLPIKNITANENKDNTLMDNINDEKYLIQILESLHTILPGTKDLKNNVYDKSEPVLKNVDGEKVDNNVKDVLNNILGIKDAERNIVWEKDKDKDIDLHMYKNNLNDKNDYKLVPESIVLP